MPLHSGKTKDQTVKNNTAFNLLLNLQFVKYRLLVNQHLRKMLQTSKTDTSSINYDLSTDGGEHMCSLSEFNILNIF